MLFLSWDWEAWCLTFCGVITPPERNTASNKGRKCFHCLGVSNNLIRPCMHHWSRLFLSWNVPDQGLRSCDVYTNTDLFNGSTAPSKETIPSMNDFSTQIYSLPLANVFCTSHKDSKVLILVIAATISENNKTSLTCLGNCTIHC